MVHLKSGLIREMTFGGMGLMRGVIFGGRGLIRGGTTVFWLGLCVFKPVFNNISVISWQSILLLEET